MDKDIIEKGLTEFFREIREVDSEIQEVAGNNIYKLDLKNKVKNICTKWFDNFSKTLHLFNINEEVIVKYNSAFEELLNLSLKYSRKNSYIKNIKIIQNNWGEELLIPILKHSTPIYSISQLPNILQNATEEEKEYLKEAIGCAKQGYYRASVILGWCATTHRMQRVVERLGFDKFNKKSEEMKNITTGRYKRFNKSYNIENFNDLQATVFDNDLIWVLDYWGLIDSNQSSRLFVCFLMRNNAAHPGEAKITSENLASFYSDIKSIVFDNSNFSL